MNNPLIIGDAELYLCNGIELMKSLPNDCVDHIITDTPYDERTHNGARTLKTEEVLIDFDYLSLDDFITFCKEGIRITKRWIIMTCPFSYAGKIEDAGLPLVRLGCWRKPNGAPQFTGDRPGQGWEIVAILHREGQKRWNDGGNHAFWTYNIVQDGYPSQKPLSLIKEWIWQFTDEGELIFDPFMGSGTTGVACLETKRLFVGCEIKEIAFNRAVKRITAEKRLNRLLYQTKLER